MAIDSHDNGRAGRGFTLVELAIVVAAIGVVLALVIPYMREREHAKLQALATAFPGEVFELHCYPSKEVVEGGEEFVIVGELLNPTPYALTILWDATVFTVPRVDGETAYILPWVVVKSPESEVAPPVERQRRHETEKAYTINPRSKLFFKARGLSPRVSPREEMTGKVSLKSWDDVVVALRGGGSYIHRKTTQIESNEVSFKVLRETSAK